MNRKINKVASITLVTFVLVVISACGTLLIETESQSSQSETEDIVTSMPESVITSTPANNEDILYPDQAATPAEPSGQDVVDKPTEAPSIVDVLGPEGWQRYHNNEFGIELWHPQGTSVEEIPPSSPTYCGGSNSSCVTEEQLFSAVVLQEEGGRVQLNQAPSSLLEIKVVANPDGKSVGQMADDFMSRCPGPVTSPVEPTTVSSQLAGYRYTCEGMMLFTEFWALFGEDSSLLFGAVWAESAAPLSEEILATVSFSEPTMTSEATKLLVHENLEYGFSLQYPDTWTVEDLLLMGGEPGSRSLQFSQDTVRLVIGYRRADENSTIVPGDLPAGDLEERNSVLILDQDIVRQVLVYEGKDKAVYYGLEDSILETSGLEFAISLQDFAHIDYEEIELSQKVQVEADAIIGTLNLMAAAEG